MTAQPPRAVIYARFSSDMQRDTSVRDQIASCAAYAEARGWRVTGHYTDHAMSGATAHRPDYQRLLSELGAGAFDVVVVETLDRLSRDQEDTAHFCKRAGYHDIEIHSVQAGKVEAMHVALGGLMGETYLAELRARTQRGMRGRVMDGKSAGGLSYGYRVPVDASGTPITGALEIVPQEAAVIRRIFRDFAAGHSPLTIAAALNAEGVPAPRGRGAGSGHWKQNTINGNRARGTGILNNALYNGERIWNRLTYKKHPDTGQRVSRLRDPSEWQHMPAPELRIVEPELWAAVKARQDANAKRRTREAPEGAQGLAADRTLRRRRFLLSGKLECSLCGGRMTIAGTGERRRYYCANHKEKGPAVCTGFRGLSQKLVELVVLDGLKYNLMTDAAYAKFREHFQAQMRNKAAADIEAGEALDARLQQTRAALERILRVIETGEGHASPTLMGRLSELEAEKAQLEAQRAELATPDLELPADLPEQHRARVNALVESLSRGGVAERAADALDRMIERIVVTDAPEKKGHRVRIVGDIVGMLGEADAAHRGKYDAASRSLELVAGVGFEPTTFRL